MDEDNQHKETANPNDDSQEETKKIPDPVVMKKLTPTNILTIFPFDVMGNIWGYCTISEILDVSRVCRTLHDFLSLSAEDLKLMEPLFSRRGENLVIPPPRLKHPVWDQVLDRIWVPTTKFTRDIWVKPIVGLDDDDETPNDEVMKERLRQWNVLRELRIVLWQELLSQRVFSLLRPVTTRTAQATTTQTDSRQEQTSAATTSSKPKGPFPNPFICWGFYQADEHWLSVYRYTDVSAWALAVRNMRSATTQEAVRRITLASSSLVNLFASEAEMRHVDVCDLEGCREISANQIPVLSDCHTSIINAARIFKQLPEILDRATELQRKICRYLASCIKTWAEIEPIYFHSTAVSNYSLIADSKGANFSYQSLLLTLPPHVVHKLPLSVKNVNTVKFFQLRALCVHPGFAEKLQNLIRIHGTRRSTNSTPSTTSSSDSDY